MHKRSKRKTFLIATSSLITAMTTAFAVYAGDHISASAPGSFLAQAVPVGASAVQQVLVMAWSEFSHQLVETCSSSTSQTYEGNRHANT